jgi:fucose permease
MALTNSIVDVAMNAQGVELERQLGRTVLSGLHAGHPLGLVAGGVAGTVAAAAEVPVVAHFAIVAAVGVALAGVATCWLVREQDQRLRSTFALPGGRVLLLGLLAFCAFALDGAAVNWSAVDLRIEHQASEALAAAAFTGFALALMIGRMVGDRLVARVGRARLVQVSAVVSGSGAALVVFGSSAALGLIGWVLFGLGLATVAPTVLGAAPRTGDAPPAVAIAAVTSVGYLGSFTGPPVVGLLAQATSLSTALLLLIAIAAALGALAKLALDPD